MGRGTREINPEFLKIGLAVAFSIGGMLYTFIRNKRIKPSKSPPDPSKSSGKESRGSKSEHHASHGTQNQRQFDPLATDKHILQEELHNVDKDAYLLPEFNDLVKEFDTNSMKTNTELPNSRVIKDNHKQETKNLRSMVKTLKEREKNLEIQLLEYYGLKEQETAVMELQNRLKLNNMEAKLFNMKIESLKSDNKRLEAQMADHTKVLAELEAAKATIKALKRKLRSETAQNKDRILDQQQRVEKMQKNEHESVEIEIDPDVELKLCKLKDLEDEAEELKKLNCSLQTEKSELAERLENVQILATAVLEDEETEKLKEESERLKKQNEELSKEIEQLQADRCGDVEELVYLRWINACLRHELRNYQPGPGKTMARDLSKTLSPKSEEKAKQLILEYANKEGFSENGMNIPELDFDQWSSSQASILTDSGELDESFVDDSSSRKTNNKFFGKLVKLLREKDNHSHSTSSSPNHLHQRHRSRSRNLSFEDMNSYSDSSFGHLGNSFKHSMDSQMSINKHSDVGGWMSSHRRIDSIAEGDGNGGCGGSSDSPSSLDGKKSELVKYAEVLRDSNSTRFHRRSSAQFSSF